MCVFKKEGAAATDFYAKRWRLRLISNVPLRILVSCIQGGVKSLPFFFILFESLPFFLIYFSYEAAPALHYFEKSY